MDTHIVLADANLHRVLNSGLEKIPNRNVNCRLAYMSGSYLALIIVLSWEVVDRPFLDKSFWSILEDFDSLTASDLVFFINHRSLEKLALSPEMIPNPGLLKGITHKHYAKGFKDCANILVGKIREYFASRYDEAYSHHYQEYLGLKLTELEKYMTS